MAKRKKKQRGKEAKPFDPSIDTGAKRPVTARVAVGDVNDKYSDYPSNGLTPGRLARIFRQADEGDVRAQMELFEEMEEKDTHLFSQMQTRKLAVVSWMYLFKNYDIKDWVSFCEVFGMPLRLGKYDASASEDDKRQLMEAIISLGTDAAGIVPSSTMIEFIESNKTTSVEIYEKLARYCDEQMSKAILGQTLTSDSGGGSYAQSKTHNDVRHDLTVADAKALAVTIRRDIIRPLVEFNFGEDAELPFFTFDCQEVEDQKETVEIYKTLVCDMGLEIPKGHIYKKFSIPEPEDGEEVLKPPVKQMAPAVTGGSEILPEKTSPEDVKTLKDGANEQQQVDGIVSMANKQAADIFREMLKPILKVIDTASDMDELQAVLKDEAKLKELYGQMESPELDDMLDVDGQPTAGTDGQSELAEDDMCWLQDLKNEALTEEGELFYEDEEGNGSYGFGMLDFGQEEFDEFTKLEIQQRIRSKMSKRSYIDAASINIDVSFEGHSYKARVTFKRNDSNTVYGISIESDGVEVIVE